MIETFDFYFKIHKIFNLEFDSNLKGMMNYVQYYLYNIDEKKSNPTTGMSRIHVKVKGGD